MRAHHVALGAALLSLIVLAGPGASAQALKKYVTPDNKVIYSDKPVPGARAVGEVAPPAPVEPAARAAAEERARRDAQESERVDKRLADRRARESAIAAAEAALERAKQRRAQGRDPLPGERSGTAGGSSTLNDTYWKRQKANDAAVLDAEMNLEAARSGR